MFNEFPINFFVLALALFLLFVHYIAARDYVQHRKIYIIILSHEYYVFVMIFSFSHSKYGHQLFFTSMMQWLMQWLWKCGGEVVVGTERSLADQGQRLRQQSKRSLNHRCESFLLPQVWLVSDRTYVCHLHYSSGPGARVFPKPPQ